MQAYILRRLLALLPTLVFTSLIVFITVRLIPGDVIDLMLSQNDISAGKLGRDQLVVALGLDRPMTCDQHLAGFGRHHAVAPALQDRHAERALELADRLRQRRLGQPELERRGREAAAARGGGEVGDATGIGRGIHALT